MCVAGKVHDVNNKLASFAVALVVTFASAFLLSAEAGSDEKSSPVLVVHGVGYPPIKAQSLAHAHLMAKRAAIIDAYRNALAETGAVKVDDDTLYTGISGFVKDITILDEEYLGDGGIRITAKVPLKSINVSSAGIGKTSKEQMWTGKEPVKITLEIWYKIIEESVRIEP